MIPCMGGWCPKRQSCANYHSPSHQPPAERLCYKGETDSYIPVKLQPTGAPIEQRP